MGSTRVNDIINLIEQLSLVELQEIYKVLQGKLEMMGWLKATESALQDQNNSEDECPYSTEVEVEHLMRLGYEYIVEESLREAEGAIHAQSEVVMRD